MIEKTKTVTVELVCCSVGDARVAEAGGAGRLELCIGLPVGGVTPSLGLLETVKESCRLPVMAMVRPREGGFVYDADEIALMERDARLLIAHGADGIVFGSLTPTGDVDAETVRRLVAIADGREAVFHRAFDGAVDPFAALETLAGLGMTRVLTSGGRKTALEGATVLRELNERAAGRIQILPGGGIRANNARQVVGETGCRQVHLAARTPVPATPTGNADVDYGGHDILRAESVAEVVAAVTGIG